MIDQYPIPALAFFDESFLPLVTSSSQLLRVNKYNHLYVTHDYGTPAGTGTAPSVGYLDYDDSAYTTLDTISIAAGATLILSGAHSCGSAQAKVEIVLTTGATTSILLLGLITESSPNWDWPSPKPMMISPASNSSLLLRIRGLRQGRTGNGSGRLFASLI